jgi:DNA-3-methyladenine glycosylase II
MSPSSLRATELLVAEHPEIARAHAMFGPARFGSKPKVDERFGRLARSIAGQQLSTTAARTIFGRVVELVGEINAESILSTEGQALRGCGLSNAKVHALHDLATHVVDGSFDLASLGRKSDEVVIESLVEVKGIGRWTAQMFLFGSLQRLDVWPTGDAGVRNGYRLLAELASSPTADDLEPLGDRFRPYRSIVAWYCWQILDNNPDP